MLIFKFLHIVSMFAAVTLISGSIVFMDLLARRGDAATYLRLDGLAQRTDMIAIGLFLAGLVFGFATALTGEFDLTASWLILAYVLVAIIFVEGIFITMPRYNHIRRVASNADPAVAGETIARLVRSPAHVALVTMVDRSPGASRYLPGKSARCHRQAPRIGGGRPNEPNEGPALARWIPWTPSRP